jgi:hypothetical protein
LLYRVRIGRDDYLGSAEEVLRYLARGEGSPARDPHAYMRAVAARLAEDLGVTDVPTDEAEAFLLALGERRVIRLETVGEPSSERHDPRSVLGEGPVTFGRGVQDGDVEGV